MMMKAVTLALALGAATSQIVAPRTPKAHGTIIHGAYDIDAQWVAFKQQYHKTYSTHAEEVERKQYFEANLANADSWNDEQVAAGGKPVFGVTKFMDRSQDEFDRANKGRKGRGMLADDYKEKTFNNKGMLTGRNPMAAPKTVDWTAAGYVTPVKNQGQCGSCWAHSAVEQIESQWMLAGYSMWEFSVQQVNSCTEGTFGCGGGDTTGAYEQIISMQTKSNPLTEGMYVPGVASAAEVPYTQSMYEECTGPLCTVNCTYDGIGNLTMMGPEEALTGYYAYISTYSYATPACTDTCADQDLSTLNENVATVAPASICVNAGRWNLYVGGVMTTEACGGFAYDDLDHCVQLTGYDLEAAEPYYAVRNSWSTNWGNDGYIYLSANGNTCGLADEATFVEIVSQ